MVTWLDQHVARMKIKMFKTVLMGRSDQSGNCINGLIFCLSSGCLAGVKLGPEIHERKGLGKAGGNQNTDRPGDGNL